MNCAAEVSSLDWDGKQKAPNCACGLGHGAHVERRWPDQSSVALGPAQQESAGVSLLSTFRPLKGTVISIMGVYTVV